MTGTVTRFPLQAAREKHLPGASPRPAAKAAAPESSKESGAGFGVSRAAPPPMHPSFLQCAENIVELGRLAMSGEFVECVSVLRKKCDEDLLFACAREPHDRAFRDALTILLTNIKHYCEADSERRPVWARAIATNKATVRDLYHLAVRG